MKKKIPADANIVAVVPATHRGPGWLNQTVTIVWHRPGDGTVSTITMQPDEWSRFVPPSLFAIGEAVGEELKKCAEGYRVTEEKANPAAVAPSKGVRR